MVIFKRRCGDIAITKEKCPTHGRFKWHMCRAIVDAKGRHKGKHFCSCEYTW